MYCAPGVATPTEAFAAIEHGLMPSSCSRLNKLRQKLPKPACGYSTIRSDVTGWRYHTGNMARYLSHGANGFGLGSALYHPA